MDEKWIWGFPYSHPDLTACLACLNFGDRLVVCKLDRLGRSSPHVLDIVTDLRDSSIAFWSLTEGMDTNTPHGELLFHVFGAPALYDHALIRDIMQALLVSARQQLPIAFSDG